MPKRKTPNHKSSFKTVVAENLHARFKQDLDLGHYASSNWPIDDLTKRILEVLKQRAKGKNEVQQAIFLRLCKTLKGKPELLDLLSGEAQIPLALLHAGIIRPTVVLADNGNPEVDRNTIGIALAVAAALELEDGIKQLPLDLSESPKLPKTKHVSILNSGIAFPLQFRTCLTNTEILEDFEKKGKTAGLGHQSIELSKILPGLSNCPRELWIADYSPTIPATSLTKLAEGHISDQLALAGDKWKLDQIIRDNRHNFVLAKVTNS